MPYRSTCLAGAWLTLLMAKAAAIGTAPAPPQVRPAGWAAVTHGNEARPDYDRLFALDRIHELRIAMDADTFSAMRENLMTVLPFGIRAGAGSPVAGAAAPVGGPFGNGGVLRLPDPSYFPATVTHDGHTWTHVGLRYKGSFSLLMGSLTPNSKLSFRLNFDRFENAHPEIANQRFYGFKELTFSSNFDDGSRMREALANELFRDRGVPAPRVPSIASS